MALSAASPVYANELLQEERAEFLRLLAGLSPEDWERPTECPAWTVHGIALHVLGDDLSLLSRQRDERPSPVAIAADAQGWDQLFVILDRFNEQWVEAATFFSPALLTELLRLSGDWTHAWYASVDPDRLGEGVPWAGLDAAPYWLLAAREYWERWIHQQQIRRAVGAQPLDDARWVAPAVAIAARGLVAGLAGLPAESGTTVTVALPEDAWTARRDDGGWVLEDGAPATPTARLELRLPDAALVFSRGLTAAELPEVVAATGDTTLAEIVVAGLGAFFGRGEDSA